MICLETPKILLMVQKSGELQLQLRLVVYPIIYPGFDTSQPWLFPKKWASSLKGKQTHGDLQRPFFPSSHHGLVRCVTAMVPKLCQIGVYQIQATVCWGSMIFRHNPSRCLSLNTYPQYA